MGIAKVEGEPEEDGEKGLHNDGFTDTEVGEDRSAHVAGEEDGADDGGAGDQVKDGDEGFGDS